MVYLSKIIPSYGAEKLKLFQLIKEIGSSKNVPTNTKKTYNSCELQHVK